MKSTVGAADGGVGIAAIALMILALNSPALAQNGWTDDGTVVRLTTSSDSVGIGTASPEALLHTSIYGSADDSYDEIARITNRRSVSNLQHPVLTFAKKRGGNAEHIYGGITVYSAGGVLGGLQFLTGDLRSTSSTNLRMVIDDNGNVGIGTANPGSYKLAVKGKIRAEEVVVETGWSDFVFEEDYRLKPLQEVETFIQTHKHLPDIPSAEEVSENGVGLGSMQAKLLQKVEELTLYMIKLDKENQALQARVAELER